MPKTNTSSVIPPCGCARCPCDRGPRCRCHDLNALLALALWDYGRMIRRRRTR
ncbi:MAG: hypothetical protein KF897_08880 [Opitutaceae bacterium]|nr:hypothetical protein [Opitutaceae bacterium]